MKGKNWKEIECPDCKMIFNSISEYNNHKKSFCYYSKYNNSNRYENLLKSGRPDYEIVYEKAKENDEINQSKINLMYNLKDKVDPNPDIEIDEMKRKLNGLTLDAKRQDNYIKQVFDSSILGEKNFIDLTVEKDKIQSQLEDIKKEKEVLLFEKRKKEMEIIRKEKELLIEKEEQLKSEIAWEEKRRNEEIDKDKELKQLKLNQLDKLKNNRENLITKETNLIVKNAEKLFELQKTRELLEEQKSNLENNHKKVDVTKLILLNPSSENSDLYLNKPTNISTADYLTANNIHLKTQDRDELLKQMNRLNALKNDYKKTRIELINSDDNLMYDEETPGIMI